MTFSIASVGEGQRTQGEYDKNLLVNLPACVNGLMNDGGNDSNRKHVSVKSFHPFCLLFNP